MMIKNYIVTLLMTIVVGSVSASNLGDSVIVHYLNKPKTVEESEMKKEKVGLMKKFLPKPTYNRVAKPSVFIPKGQWILGTTVSYSENSSENYDFLIVENIQNEGYTVKTEAFFGYALFNDGVLGFRAGYQRSWLDLGNLNLSINDDLDLNVKDYYNLSHTYVGTVFLRNYISLFGSNRFGLFNDTQISVERGQGKSMSGSGETLTGTYTETAKFSVGISPGLTVFITDFAAFEASVAVLGFQSQWVKQTKDQVETGNFHKSSANFKVNLFSLRLGMTFYLNTKKVKMK